MSHFEQSPSNKVPMSERKLRSDLVCVYGENSEHVAMLDDILHRMWAAEDRVEQIDGQGLHATG